ncbi:hypothetical protein BDR26DRAFT_849603 [Obelidium mucronatum]|nr:hypothetical protein BDR26DRAFT_849603 [Obelidium mucronatum]
MTSPEFSIIRIATFSNVHTSSESFRILSGKLCITPLGFMFADGSTESSISVMLLPAARLSIRKHQSFKELDVVATVWTWTGVSLVVASLVVVRSKALDSLHQQPSFTVRVSDFALESVLDSEREYQGRLWRQNSASVLLALDPTLPFEFNVIANSDLDAADYERLDIVADRIRRLKKLKRVSLFGMVEAKSALLEIQGTHFFIVTLVCGDSIVNSGCSQEQSGVRIITAHILFEQRTSAQPEYGKQISSLYEDILVNQIYIFINMDTKQIKFTSKLPDPEDPLSNIKKLLSFNFLDSEIYPLDEAAANMFIGQKRTLSSSFPSTPLLPTAAPHAHQCSISPTKIVTYTGVITRVLDLEVGKYQLDNKHELYLTYHPILYTTEQLLTPGTTLTLHNIHIILFESSNVPATIPNRAVFVACLNTSLEILETSFIAKSSSLDPKIIPQKRHQMKLKWSGLNMMDLVLLDDLYSLILAFKDPLTRTRENHSNSASFHLAKEILKRCQGFEDWPAGAGDPKLASVLIHAKECTVSVAMICGSSDRHNLDAGAVEEYIQEMRSNLCGDSDGFGSGGVYLAGTDRDHQHGFRVFGRKELGIEHCFLMGTISWMNGGLHFLDSSGSEPIMIHITASEEGNESLTANSLKTCVVILDFEVVVEILGLSHSSDETSLIVKRYIRCLMRDCLFKHHWMPSNTCRDALDSLTHANQDLESIFIFVKQKSSPSICLNRDGRLSIKARILGTVWKIAVDEIGEESQVVECFENAICEVCHESMHIWEIVDLNGYYLLSNVRMTFFENDGGPVVSASLFCSLTEHSKVHFVSLETAPSIQMSGLFDFSHQTPKLYMEPIPPCGETLSVTKLLHSLANVPIAYKSFHNTVVSVQGKITSKSFTVTTPLQLHERLPAIKLLQEENIGLGRYDHIMVLKISDNTSQPHNSPESTLQIYLDTRIQSFQPGLVPGSFIRIYALGIKMAATSRTLYGQGISETWIQILESGSNNGSVEADDLGAVSSADYFKTKLHSFPRLFLVHLYSVPASLKLSPFTILCTITHLEEISLWCQCSRCGVKPGGNFASGCKCTGENGGSSPLRVQGKSKLYVEDGTGEAMVLLESFEALIGLFGVSGGNVKNLEDAIINAAGIDIEYFKNPPWVSDEVQLKADSICPEKDAMDGIEHAKFLARDFVLCCRQLSSSWHQGTDDDYAGGAEVDEFDLRNILIKKQVKLAEGAMIQVLAPPRIEASDSVIEGMRIQWNEVKNFDFN